MKAKKKIAKVTRRTVARRPRIAFVPPVAPIVEAPATVPTVANLGTPTPAPIVVPRSGDNPPPAPAAATPTVETPSVPAPVATDFKVGTLVQFYCPSALRMMREKVTGHLPEHNWVTLESGRHFPAREVSVYTEQ